MLSELSSVKSSVLISTSSEITLTPSVTLTLRRSSRSNSRTMPKKICLSFAYRYGRLVFFSSITSLLYPETGFAQKYFWPSGVKSCDATVVSPLYHVMVRALQ